MVTLAFAELTHGVPMEAITGKSPDLQIGEAGGIKSLTLLEC